MHINTLGGLHFVYTISFSFFNLYIFAGLLFQILDYQEDNQILKFVTSLSDNPYFSNLLL